MLYFQCFVDNTIYYILLNQMIELRWQWEKSNEIIDEATICAQVLGGERNRYIPGLGPILGKKQSSNSSYIEA